MGERVRGGVSWSKTERDGKVERIGIEEENKVQNERTVKGMEGNREGKKKDGKKGEGEKGEKEVKKWYKKQKKRRRQRAKEMEQEMRERKRGEIVGGCN